MPCVSTRFRLRVKNDRADEGSDGKKHVFSLADNEKDRQLFLIDPHPTERADHTYMAAIIECAYESTHYRHIYLLDSWPTLYIIYIPEFILVCIQATMVAAPNSCSTLLQRVVPSHPLVHSFSYFVEHASVVVFTRHLYHVHSHDRFASRMKRFIHVPRLVLWELKMLLACLIASWLSFLIGTEYSISRSTNWYT